jgi:hypothetical protein
MFFSEIEFLNSNAIAFLPKTSTLLSCGGSYVSLNFFVYFRKLNDFESRTFKVQWNSVITKSIVITNEFYLQ